MSKNVSALLVQCIRFLLMVKENVEWEIVLNPCQQLNFKNLNNEEALGMIALLKNLEIYCLLLKKLPKF